MELLSSETHFIVVDGSQSLWINRKNGSFTAKTEGSDELLTTGAVCLGTVYGFIGKLHFNDSAEARLVFIQKRAKVGEIKGCDLYRVCSIVTVPLETESELLLEPCYKSHVKPGFSKSKAFTPIEPVTTTTSVNTNNRTTTSLQKVTSTAGNPSKLLNFSSTPKRSDKIERRMLDEFSKMFTEAESFFYSNTYDITNTVQRSFISTENKQTGMELPLWKQADSRFFWNIHLMNDLINSKDSALDRWIVPVMQGFVQHETCDVNQFEVLGDQVSGYIDMYIISRRSRFRAGTRYLRRGLDEYGKVANYVETEQILAFKGHVISFVQVRGSIPVFWSQPGYKYRPPPRLDRTEEENMSGFTKHYHEEEAIYGPITAVNLVEKGGKEKVVGDAYLEYVIRYNSPNVSYFAFDFHENCRGMRFENVAILVEKLSIVLKNMNYCWVDSYGMVLRQEGVCRVNCIDCLDRTNVVQTHIAKHMLVVQLSKLGLLVPDFGLPNNVKLKLQILWANNGDTISKQYAGTNALKGDFTRTGERRLAGVMKDGMNSANRYYLNRFKDTSRQAAIDVILGVKTNITEEDLDGEKAVTDEKENTAEQIKQVIDDVKKCVVPTFDVILGAWGLVNARTNDPDSMDIDTIFILTDSHYYVTEYDCMLDAVTETEKIPLNNLESIEIGCESISQPSNIWSIFHSSSSMPKGIPNIRLNYEHSGQVLYHQFRSSNIRFFNNVVITVNHNPEEMLESLKMIAEAVEAAMSIVGKKITVTEMALLPAKEAPRSSNPPGLTPSWVQRYFSFGNEDASEKHISAELLTQGSAQDKSKFYRRGSLISTPSQTDSGIDSVSESNSGIQCNKKKWKEEGDELGTGERVGSDEDVLAKPLSVDEILLSMTVSTDISEKKEPSKFTAKTPKEGYRSFLVPSKDLVLPSCGIVSVHENNFTSSLTALLSAHELIVDVDGFASPVTPTVPSFPLDFEKRQLPESPQLPSNSKSPSIEQSPSHIPSVNTAILQRHRHSLPANSLSLNQATIGLLQRPITPEITITEEPSNSEELIRIDSILSPMVGNNIKSVAGAKLAVIPKRISRSSEDVNRISGTTLHSSMVNRISSTYNKFGGGQLNLKLERLSPSVSKENRSSSDLDIFGSLINMKGSHSDTTLRENQATNKKDVVFSPFGKLARGMQNIGANYLDPRKLKGSFKQTKLESMKIMTQKKEEATKEDNTILLERIKNCKSLIVDV
ncbi:unnamed protein product [Allacma fusca]|uniref:SAC domain-containing protein n=1 Tax=Allacma fusca TaxID=39272 RepID=A0A8J2L6D9_9HEXA|nr:unnamed protein product [Allacma fusca]